jgi:hypothetical protein
VKPALPTGDGAGAERHAHRTQHRCRLPRLGGDGGEVQSSGGCCAGDLVHQHRARETAAPLRRDGLAQRDIVGDHHGLDRDALGAREFCRQAEVQSIAGVVLHDKQRASRAGGGADRRQNSVGRRRREDIARDGRVQHARRRHSPRVPVHVRCRRRR